MKRHKPYLAPADWRSPNLPCIRDYKLGNGKHLTEVTAEYEQQWRAILMQTSAHPGWRQDPTYNMKKGRK